MLSFFPLSILPLLSMPLCEHNLKRLLFYLLSRHIGECRYTAPLSPLPAGQLAEERAERDRLTAALREALAYVTPTQARRICAYYLGGMAQRQVADRERVHNSNVCLSIRRGLCNLRRYYADHPQGK